MSAERQQQQQQQAPPEPQERGKGWEAAIGVSRETCTAFVEKSTSRNPVVKFMIDQMRKSGCEVPDGFIQIENCDQQVGGGFRPPDGVVVCHNHLSTQEEVDHALTHELVHAYDHCRGKNLDWTNCQHHACSEVRAAALSGDCNFKMEMLRGNLGLRGQFMTCVRRRAEISVKMNPYCQGPRAKAAVDAVFEGCLRDTAPFDRIP